MDSLSPIQFFLLNVLSISLFAVIVEIVVEKEKGWGAGLNKNRWYGKVIGEKNPVLKFLARSAGVPYFFGYAIFMYFILVPCTLLLEYFFVDQSIFLFGAIYFSILAVEDFTWFLLNPYFPSLRELLKGPHGNIWWHKKWVPIGKLYLPQSYFTSAVIVGVLLMLDGLI